MTRSPLFNFCAGIVAGGMLATLIVLHIVTGQVQAHTKQCVEAIDSTANQCTAAIEKVRDEWRKATDLWEARAEKCEVRDRNATALYEYRPEELPGLAILHGAFSINLGSRENRPGSMKLVWVIPAQVPVYTNIPGAQFEWIDGKTGASIGRFPATPPPSTEAQQ